MNWHEPHVRIPIGLFLILLANAAIVGGLIWL